MFHHLRFSEFFVLFSFILGVAAEQNQVPDPDFGGFQGSPTHEIVKPLDVSGLAFLHDRDHLVRTESENVGSQSDMNFEKFYNVRVRHPSPADFSILSSTASSEGHPDSSGFVTKSYSVMTHLYRGALFSTLAFNAWQLKLRSAWLPYVLAAIPAVTTTLACWAMKYKISTLPRRKRKKQTLPI